MGKSKWSLERFEQALEQFSLWSLSAGSSARKTDPSISTTVFTSGPLTSVRQESGTDGCLREKEDLTFVDGSRCAVSYEYIKSARAGLYTITLHPTESRRAESELNLMTDDNPEVGSIGIAWAEHLRQKIATSEPDKEKRTAIYSQLEGCRERALKKGNERIAQPVEGSVSHTDMSVPRTATAIATTRPASASPPPRVFEIKRSAVPSELAFLLEFTEQSRWLVSYDTNTSVINIITLNEGEKPRVYFIKEVNDIEKQIQAALDENKADEEMQNAIKSKIYECRSQAMEMESQRSAQQGQAAVRGMAPETSG
jgi:ribosomal 50S subunit-associated protein YjgA (DUF615 family)